MHIFVRPALPLALLAIALLPACQKAQDAAVAAALEHATGAKVDKHGNETTIKTDAGELRVNAAEAGDSIPLPADFPDDVYLPDQHRVASVMDISGAKVVNLTAPAPLATTFSSTGERMEKSGWKREMAMQSGDGGSLSFSKDKRHAVYYLAKSEAGGTDLTVNISHED